MLSRNLKCFCCNQIPAAAAASSESGSSRSHRFATSKELRRGSTSYWTGMYDTTVRTASYNEFRMRVEVLEAQRLEISDIEGAGSRHVVDGLLSPDQERVEEVLKASDGRPEILKLAEEYFDSSKRACRLCGDLLEAIREARGQCRQMEETLASVPASGELGAVVQRQIRVAESLQGMVEARNPFAGREGEEGFEEARGRYGKLTRGVEERRDEVGRMVRLWEWGWRGGTAGVVAVAAGVVVALVVVAATHGVAGMAAAPAAGAAATVVRKRGRGGSGRGLTFWRRQRARLEALTKGAFTVNRMLDTLRCLVARLHEDLERTRRLVAFSWDHRDEPSCIQQVARQLIKSHQQLVQQLSHLEEQVVVCFLLINKARDWALQEFAVS